MRRGFTGVIIIVITMIILSFSGYVIYKTNYQKKYKVPPKTNSIDTQVGSTQRNLDFSTLNFTITAPPSFQVDERITGVLLVNDEGKITVSKSGTDYETLDDYWQFYLDSNNLQDIGEKKLKIDKLDVVSAKVYETKIYIIFKEGIVYTLSTESEFLFDDLDQIAQSFRYTP